jgi:predicted ATPase with chaperone activity
VDVEVDLAPGLPAFATVGLPDGAVKESKDRVRTPLKNSGYDFPARRITANLAPADIKKEGAAYDPPISIGILAATGVIKPTLLQKYTLLAVRPFRSPHHTISDVGLIGGGTTPKPLEDGCVTISRSLVSLTYPSLTRLTSACHVSIRRNCTSRSSRRCLNMSMSATRTEHWRLRYVRGLKRFFVLMEI